MTAPRALPILSPVEWDVLIDALRDYAEGADEYEADDEDEAARIIDCGITARGLMARAETQRKGVAA